MKRVRCDCGRTLLFYRDPTRVRELPVRCANCGTLWILNIADEPERYDA